VWVGLCARVGGWVGGRGGSVGVGVSLHVCQLLGMRVSVGVGVCGCGHVCVCV